MPDEFPVSSWSSHGEDRVAMALLERSGIPVGAEGLFVDVGAYHPTVASNSAAFYQHGWRVLAVEPNPYMAALWRSEAPLATVVEAAVNADGSPATLFFFYDWASSNTLDADFAREVAASQSLPPATEKHVEGTTLARLLADHVPAGQVVDVLNVDVEGLDLEVLQSNDWDAHRPRLICVEDLHLDLSNLSASPIYNFLAARGYVLRSHAVLTSFYLNARDLEEPS